MNPQNILKTVTSLILVLAFALASVAGYAMYRDAKALLSHEGGQGSHLELATGGGQIGRRADSNGGQIG